MDEHKDRQTERLIPAYLQKLPFSRGITICPPSSVMGVQQSMVYPYACLLWPDFQTKFN